MARKFTLADAARHIEAIMLSKTATTMNAFIESL